MVALLSRADTIQLLKEWPWSWKTGWSGNKRRRWLYSKPSWMFMNSFSSPSLLFYLILTWSQYQYFFSFFDYIFPASYIKKTGSVCFSHHFRKVSSSWSKKIIFLYLFSYSLIQSSFIHLPIHSIHTFSYSSSRKLPNSLGKSTHRSTHSIKH